MDTKALLFCCVVSVFTQSVRAQNATRPETEVNLHPAAADAPSQVETGHGARIKVPLPALDGWSPRLSLTVEPIAEAAATLDSPATARVLRPKRRPHRGGEAMTIHIGDDAGIASFSRSQAAIAPVQASIIPQRRSISLSIEERPGKLAQAPGVWDVFTSFLLARHLDPAPAAAQQNHAVMVAFRAAF